MVSRSGVALGWRIMEEIRRCVAETGEVGNFVRAVVTGQRWPWEESTKARAVVVHEWRKRFLVKKRLYASVTRTGGRILATEENT